jgi:M6 family metalloprotease-like protein
VPGKKGPQAPRYGRTGATVGETPPTFRPLQARAPLLGAATYNVLAIRVAFSDTPIDSPTAYYDRHLLFLHQYWNQVSDGQVTITPTLWDSVFTLPHTMGYYGDDDRFQERLVFMVRDMVAAADSTVDFRSYQSIIIFHAGAGQEADVFDDSRDQIWSAFVTPDDFEQILPDSTGAIGIKTNDLISPGVFYRVKEAVEVPEVESQDGYAFGSTGVICHEFGHQLGRLVGQISMPDLYDTTGEEGGSSQGIGSWDIMGGGVWNANGFVPAGISAWTRLWLGFLAPLRVTTGGSYTLSQLERQVGSDPRVLQIPITQSEHFLIENRRHDLDGNGKFTFDDVNLDGCFDFYTDSYAGAEFDFFLPSYMTEPSGVGCDAGTYQSGSGVVIYHIDDSKIEAGLATNTVNGDARRKGIDVVEADGIEDLDGPPTSLSGGSPDDVFRAGWRDRFTPDTTPSTAAYGNVRTGISVTAISAADSVMSLDVSFDRTRAGWPKVLGNARIRNLPALAADLNGNGVLELIVPVQRLNNTGAVYVFEPDGTDFLDGDAVPTAFATTASAPTSSPCVGDIDGVAGVEIVFQTLNGAIYAYHANGTEVMDGDGDPATTGILHPPLIFAGTNAQPILVDLDGDGALDVVTGSSATAAQLGGSTLRVVSISGGVKRSFTRPMGGSTEGPPAAADLNGDGLPEVIISNVITVGEDNAVNGLSIVNWEILNDGLLPADFSLFVIREGGPFSAPVLADVNRDGAFEIMVADHSGAFHAFRLSFSAHILGDPPNEALGGYVHVTEIAGWPTTLGGPGRISEVSIGDLEQDGYPELFHTGDDVRITALHYNGAPRSGFPIRAALAYAVADTAGFWPPLIADVDGDGIRDVIAILPDGRRPAYRADGSAIHDFVELGSTGASAPPMLLDLDANGTAEWVEAHDASPTQATVTVRDAPLAVPVSALVWTQYRNSETRNAVVTNGPAGPAGGTQNLTAVYAYPNPSHTGTTTIHYRLAEAATSVSVRILDPTGATVADLPVGAGNLAGSAEHAVPWDHRSVASGVYSCRVEVRSSKGTEIQFASLAVVR